MRTRVGRYVAGMIIGTVALVFVFYGIYTRDPMNTSASAGSVNGVQISYADFSRALNQKMAMFQGMKIAPEQLKQFGIYDSVFRELAQKILMVREAERQKIVISDEEVRNVIRDIVPFQNEGKFDAAKYEAVLKANGMTPAGFEKRIREDLVAQYWERFFNEAAYATPKEIEEEYLTTENQRTLQYVLLDLQKAESELVITDAEVTAFLQMPENAKHMASLFQAQAETLYKGKKLEDVQSTLAKQELRNNKLKVIQKEKLALADQLAKGMDGSKGSEAKIKALLKASKGELQTSAPLTLKSAYLPGIGYAEEAVKDAFVDPSPLDPKAKGKAKVYQIPRGFLVAVLTGKKVADLASLKDDVRQRMRQQIESRQQRGMMSDWLERLTKDAKIVKNEQVLANGGS